ncbi:MAG: protecting protein DprA protein [Candidatus Daviesbacteria bacterium GW2011_GWA1_36_8]|uniref:Protecting protein DprA protein n=1 Tax=Candidatus Daviesbacteria bacterium GW2011_GWA1_36_8 TaxID=1618417 RepID=A0A0G0FAE7_9BACT|nr:MAG: protecting protein DprA protein [Candidatus Daviesbacteria bacterium GW2011_GWA1_36_8]
MQTSLFLGGGISKIFPPENTSLALKILENGAVLSEYHPDSPHLPGNFPARNRIIAGLSLGVLVTEAAQDSGSLITARLALEQGREVFAVPGPITSTVSEGTADLIKEGARVVTKVEDILEELGIEQYQITNDKLQMTNLSEMENQILKCLENETMHIDEICRQLKKPASEVSAHLIKMEIQGFIKNLGGGNYTN